MRLSLAALALTASIPGLNAPLFASQAAKDFLAIPMDGGVFAPSGGAGLGLWTMDIAPGKQLISRGRDTQTFLSKNVVDTCPGTFNADRNPDFLAVVALPSGGHAIELYTAPLFNQTTATLLAADTSIVGSTGATFVDAAAVDVDGDGLDEVAVLYRPAAGPAQNLDLRIFEVSLGNLTSCLQLQVAADLVTFDTYYSPVQLMTGGLLAPGGAPGIAALRTPQNPSFGGDRDLITYSITPGEMFSCCSAPVAIERFEFDQTHSWNWIDLQNMRLGTGADHLAMFRQKGGDVDLRVYSAPGALDGSIPPVIQFAEGWMFDLGIRSLREVTVTTANKQQEIEGFGASLAWGPGFSLLSDTDRAEVGTLLFRDLGATLLRLRTMPQIEETNENSDDQQLDLGAFNFCNGSPSCPAPLDRVLTLWDWALGVPGCTIDTVVTTSWTPPAFMKTNNSLVGGYLMGHMFEEYAEWYSAFVLGLEAYRGITVKAVSLQNEPDSFFSYDSMKVQPSQYCTVLPILENRLAAEGLSVDLMGPESESLNSTTSYIQQLAQQCSGTLSQLDIAATHCYGDNGYPQWAAFASACATHIPQASRWLTEWSDLNSNDEDITGATYFLRPIFEGLATGGLNAVLGWSYLWFDQEVGVEGLIKVDHESGAYRVTKQYWGFRHLSQFVRPGYTRVGSGSSHSDLKALAFTGGGSGGADGEVIVVLLNDNEWGVLWRSTSTRSLVEARLTTTRRPAPTRPTITCMRAKACPDR